MKFFLLFLCERKTPLLFKTSIFIWKWLRKLITQNYFLLFIYLIFIVFMFVFIKFSVTWWYYWMFNLLIDARHLKLKIFFVWSKKKKKIDAIESNLSEMSKSNLNFIFFRIIFGYIECGISVCGTRAVAINNCLWWHCGRSTHNTFILNDQYRLRWKTTSIKNVI